jgi:sugar phosphate isomerase/epimerase
MKLSVSISPIWRKYGLSEAQIWQEMKNCGFDYADIDFCPENCCGWTNGSAAEWAEDFRLQMQQIGISPVSAHIAGFDPLTHDGFESIARAVRCCGALNIKTAVIPLGWRENNTRREYEEANKTYLRKLLPVAEEAGVTLLIEACDSWLQPQYTHHAIELMRMLEKLNMPSHLKVNLNIANMTAADIRPYTELHLLGNTVYHVDAADNFGSMPLAVHPEREQLGFAPLMGYTNYDAVMQGLCEAGYDGFFNLRMNMPAVFEKNSPYCESKLAVMPKALTARLLVWSRHAAEHILRSYDCLSSEKEDAE